MDLMAMQGADVAWATPRAMVAPAGVTAYRTSCVDRARLVAGGDRIEEHRTIDNHQILENDKPSDFFTRSGRASCSPPL